MLEPPSKDLLQLLIKLKLCTAADLRSCRRRVKKLARGIPAFDSVWLDALVQAQKITPFQAKTLESGNPEQLAVGPYLLISELGRSHKSNTYLAKTPDSTELFALKLTRPQNDNSPLLQQNLQDLLNRLPGLDHPSLVLPRVIKQLPENIVIISHYVPSIPVSELLIRRGRLPEHIVHAIGTQLLDALVTLEKRNVIHSDIRPWNVRVNSSGSAVLVDTGTESILSPELTIHAALPPRCYDGIAPELIGTGRQANTQSDLYALGCLLWELLAGRPPFTTGDPLAKLACHQTKDIPDIRSWAPETSRENAKALLKFTASNPEQRPSSMLEAQKLWPTHPKHSGNVLKKFYASFQTQSSRTSKDSTPKKSGRLPLVAALIFVLSGLSLSLLDEGARNQLLKITSQITLKKQSEVKSPSSLSSSSTKTTARKKELIPPPNEKGIIILDSMNPYEATKINHVGPLTIKGSSDTPAVIQIHDESLSITAEQLILENVILVSNVETSNTKTQTDDLTTLSHAPALLNVATQSVIIKACIFTQINRQSQNNRVQVRNAIYWKPIDSQQQNQNQLAIQNSVFAVSEHAIQIAHAPHSVLLNNCLNISSRSTFFFEQPPNIDQQIQLSLRHVTLRETGALLLFDWHDPKIIPGTVQIETQDCVFDLTQGAALIQAVGSKPPDSWFSSVSLIGEGSLASADIQIAGWKNVIEQSIEELNPSEMLIEGLSTGKFQYAAPLSLSPADSLIKEAQVPRKSATPPGIQIKQIPEFISRLNTLKN